MTPDEKAKNKEKTQPAEPDKGVRVLLHPDEWKEPAERKVIAEYHKDGLPESASDIESDLDSFEEYWEERGDSKIRSEYHKKGAPYMEAPSEWDGHRPRLGEIPDQAAEDTARAGRDAARKGGGGAGENGSAPSQSSDMSKAAAQAGQRALDISTVELLTFAVFRAFFGRGVHVPIKVEGLIDVDIIVKDRDITLNTNEVQFEAPDLSVWRFAFAYKGKPVIEYGRGVKNSVKIHYYRMFTLLLAMWWNGWKKKRARAKACAAADKEAAAQRSEAESA